MDALSVGAIYLDGIATMPNISSLFLTAPTVEVLSDGGRRITLHFLDQIETRLQLLNVDPLCFMASLVETITTYVPSVSTVLIESGNTMLQSVSGKTGTMVFQNGLAKKDLFTDSLKTTVSIYLVQNSRLIAVERTVPWKSANNPCVLFATLASGATESERDQGIASPLPEGLDETDLLGLDIEGSDLLIHLSPRAARSLRQAGEEIEQFACYSMVTTLCELTNTKRAVFFFDGEMKETLGGRIYWGGSFFLNYSITD